MKEYTTYQFSLLSKETRVRLKYIAAYYLSAKHWPQYSVLSMLMTKAINREYNRLVKLNHN